MFLFVVFYYCLANLFLVILTKRKFGFLFPFTLMLSTLINYISGIIFNSFFIGYIVNLFLIMVSLIYIFCNRKNKTFYNEFKNNYFSNGFIITIIIGVFFFIYDYNRIFVVWDELSHWGIMVKNMININNFYSDISSTLQVHRDYPPIIPLFEMYSAVITGGTFRESLISQSLHMFELSLIIPALSEMNTKNKKTNIILKTLISIIIFLLMIELFDIAGIINTIYIDYCEALLCSFGLYYVFSYYELSNLGKTFLLSILLSFLVLSKDIGVPLYLIILLFVVISTISSNKKIVIKQNIVNLILLVIIPFLFLLSWKIEIRNFHYVKEFDMTLININFIKSIFTLNNTNEGAIFYYNYLRETILTNGLLKLSFFSALIIGFIILYLINNRYKIDKKKMISLALSIGVGHIGYYFMFLILITLAKNTNNGPFVGSLTRYLDTYLLIVYGTIFMIYIKELLSSNKLIGKKLIIITLILLLILTPAEIGRLYPEYKKANNPNASWEKYANEITKNLKSGSKVFFLTMENNHGQNYYIQYYADRLKFNNKYFAYLSDKEIWKNETDEVLEYIKEFDYFYLINYDEDFKNDFSNVFDEIDENSIYIIDKNSNVLFKKIEKDVCLNE